MAVARGGTVAITDDLAWIYGVALAATDSTSAAERVTERVVRCSAPGAPRPVLVAEAVRLAMCSAPAPPYDALDPDAREALALVRLAGLRVDEVAQLIGEDVLTVKRRLTHALRQLAACAIAA